METTEKVGLVKLIEVHRFGRWQPVNSGATAAGMSSEFYPGHFGVPRHRQRLRLTLSEPLKHAAEEACRWHERRFGFLEEAESGSR